MVELKSKSGLQMIVFIMILGGCVGGATIKSNPKQWHTVTLDFEGPQAGAADSSPNPFLDYRLQVVFTGPSGQRYDVCGFFDGDGQGNGSGNCWRVRFTPDEPGRWRYATSFVHGNNVALDKKADGTPVVPDGQTGDLSVEAADRRANGFHRWGRLEYVGGHYLKFRAGPYWIKGGTDSPENFLSYQGFDNTRSGSRFGVKTYREHVRDWRTGDPDWDDGRGRGIIGAINYLADQHVNLIYFLPMNIGGDGRDTWPFVGPVKPGGDPSNDNLHYDISKLHQWEIVFAHAQAKGIVLHFVFNEAEKNNKLELGGRELTTERQLFYREMIARFGHHNAVLWNLCEEYNLGLDLGAESIRRFASYIRQIDPYGHPITVHHAGDPVQAWRPFIGDERFSITSIQIGRKDIEPVVERFRRLTAEAGRPLPIAIDEFTVTLGDKQWLPVADAEALRKEKLWPAYLSGGQLEFIVAELLETEDFRKYEDLWQYIWYARRFMEEYLPFWEMQPADELLTGETVHKGKTCSHDAQVFAAPGRCYAIYLPTATQTGVLDLSGTQGQFIQRWYDPRSGRFEGDAISLESGRRIELGLPPADISQDWAVLISRPEG